MKKFSRAWHTVCGSRSDLASHFNRVALKSSLTPTELPRLQAHDQAANRPGAAASGHWAPDFLKPTTIARRQGIRQGRGHHLMISVYGSLKAIPVTKAIFGAYIVTYGR